MNKNLLLSIHKEETLYWFEGSQKLQKAQF